MNLARLDQRIIYLLIALALAIPLISRSSLPATRMPTARAYFDTIEQIAQKQKRFVLISADWGPGGVAENKPQTENTIEHLMRRRIPFALISSYPLASPFLESVPKEVAQKLEKETGERWLYGVDWVNWGYRPNGFLMIQSLAKSPDLHTTLEADAQGTPIGDLPVMENIHTIRDISLLAEITGLVGVFNNWIQYFQTQDYRPPFVHGCTSITIPEAYNFFASGQIVGLFEGVAGAASYDQLLSETFRSREDSDAVRNNTSIAVAQLLIVFLVILGNFASFWNSRRNAQSHA